MRVENADLNGIVNAAFYAGDVGQLDRGAARPLGRAGRRRRRSAAGGAVDKAARRLGRIGAARIVYVSCNPTTRRGTSSSYARISGTSLRRIRPVDMFPHTPHVESVSLLERAPSASRGT